MPERDLTQEPAPSPPVQQRNLPLDVLRTISVLLVIGRHAEYAPREFATPFRELLMIWIRVGWVAVGLFFVLSGFLVSGLLFREQERFGRVRPMNFYMRRGFKIYPAFYVFLAITTYGLAKSGAYPDWPRGALIEAVFLQNYLGSLWPHTWSLAVEEHFYLMLPPLLMWLFRQSEDTITRKAVTAFLLLAATSLGLRFWVNSGGATFDYRDMFFVTHLRLDGLFFGVLLSFLYHKHRERMLAWVARYHRLLPVVAILCALPLFFLALERSPYLRTIGYTTNYICFGAVILWSLFRPAELARTSHSLLKRVLARIGSYSFSIYLWHMPVRVLLRLFERQVLETTLPPALGMVIYVACSIVVGIAMSLLVEIPLLKVRDRWFPSRSGTLLPKGS